MTCLLWLGVAVLAATGLALGVGAVACVLCPRPPVNADRWDRGD